MVVKNFISVIFTFLLFLFFAFPANAATSSYTITTGIPARFAVRGETFFTKNITLNYQSGNIVFSALQDGTGSTFIDDAIEITVTKPNGTTTKFINSYQTGCSSLASLPPKDITNLFAPGENKVSIRLYDICGVFLFSSSLYLVNLDAPDIGPAPFLDLPWNYEDKGLSFTEAALNINSFFDHEYPLLSTGLSEPSLVIKYDNPFRIDESYTSHDGYDYGKRAKVNFGDPVLAAAPGTATFVNSCGACGNAIHIDHGNDYQTRYYHLQSEELITNIPGQEIQVNAGEKIGRVGTEGNCRPKEYPGDIRCAHIHFMVVQDKNGDGDFEDNIPDGLVDPFGWQSEEPDPWESYGKSNEFFYKGENRVGNKSYYLWKKQIDNLNANLSANGGVFTSGRNTVTVPEGATDQNLLLEMISAPVQKISDFIVSIGSSVDIKAYDPLGIQVTSFNTPITIGIDFSGYDLSRYLIDTISIYSSNDGINWQKEETNVDLINEKTTAEVYHLTYFALMAERLDTTAATTTAVLNGEEGEDNWFRSDVTVELTAEDNPGGLGVDYTLYKLDGGDWQEYTAPLEFSEEGNHTIEFYSVDNDENIEEVKSVTFSIDKTPPIVSISASPSVLWPPNGKMVPVTVEGDVNDSNLYTKSIQVIDEYGEITPTVNDFGETIMLKAKRKGSDKDGKVYIIKVEAVDLAGNISSASAEVVVPHDQREE